MSEVDKKVKNGSSMITLTSSPVIPAEAGICLDAKRPHFTEIPASAGMTVKKGDNYLELTLNMVSYIRLLACAQRFN